MIEADKLKALIAAATDEDLADGGRYFGESFDDLTRCRHEEIGEYQHRADGELIEYLWNNRAAIASQAVELEALRQQADKFKWQVRDTCARAETAEREFERLREALTEARAALHQHYVDWDGEPEDAVPLQLARAKCDAALAPARSAPVSAST